MKKPITHEEQSFLSILKKKGLVLPPEKQKDVLEFTNKESVRALLLQIEQNEDQLMSKWKLKQRLNDINLQSWVIPNATVGKEYVGILDVIVLKIEDIEIHDIQGLENLGLSWSSTDNSITGTPNTSGTTELVVKFCFGNLQPVKYYSKSIHLVINPDPRTLWKNLPSDQTAPFWKTDNAMDAATIGGRSLVVCSKRGRSHQHKGTFRDDHYSFSSYETNGWSVVAVSDGAGSAKYSREGSKIACEAVINYFHTLSDSPTPTALAGLDKMLSSYSEMPPGEDIDALSNHAKKKLLYPAVIKVHETLKSKVQEFAKAEVNLFDNESPLEQLSEFHATLIFCLFKKFKYGYVLLSFGVGDCPISVAYTGEDNSPQVKLLNLLDVGEYGGGTRFITQPKIFAPQAEIPMAKRFSMNIVPNFDYLFLMTDGIYDPKFEVEANLEKVEYWLSFVKDLRGDNEDEVAINFEPNNSDVAPQLSAWMDFFSKGNHDDRTLAVIY